MRRSAWQVCRWAGLLLVAPMLGVAACRGESSSRPPAPGDAAPGDGPGGDATPGGVCSGSDATPGGACPQGAFTWPVATQPVPITASPAWKNQLAWEDPFIVLPAYSSGDRVRWAKLVILMEDPTVVYFQDGNAERFHAEFAIAHLDPFVGMTAAEFNQVSMHTAGQQAILGTLLFPEATVEHEVLVQLHGEDAYHPDFLLVALDLIRDALVLPVGTQLFYAPAFDQQDCACEAEALLAAAGFPLASLDRWRDGSACYAGGWAVGTLRAFTGSSIDAAYASGALTPTDVLLTDAVPAEVPFVAGILCTAPSTPNSHVSILARSFAIPFAYLRDAETVTRAVNLVGRTVGVSAEPYRDDPSQCRVRLFDLETHLAPAEVAALLADRVLDPLTFAPKVTAGVSWRDTDDIGPQDIDEVGGKAAHYGLLRDVVPEVAPDAIAFTFDLFDAFMAQPTTAGPSLRQSIDTRLAVHGYPPASMQQLLFDLDAVRELVRVQSFAAVDQAAIVAALAGFDPEVRLRFRSSTNLEDSESFTGAGLYDSETGCLADDLDSDAAGPSACNPAQPEERGVLRALARVYASFWRDNAFLERRRRDVDEALVGMAVLVHPSYPDTEELANGVGVLEAATYSLTVTLSTQAGAVSVANAEPGAAPEVVQVDVYSFGTYADLQSGSGLLPVGATVLAWDETWPESGVNEYATLAGHFDVVAAHYAAVTGKSSPFALDFEYKKLASGLVIKQVRPLPLGSAVRDRDRFLVGEPVAWCVFQGESSTAAAIHRLKSRWQVSADSRRLDAAGVAGSFYGATVYEYVAAGSRATLTGIPAAWPSASHRVDTQPGAITVLDEFALSTVAPSRAESLALAVPAPVRREDGPFVTLADLPVVLTARYAQPVPTFDYDIDTGTVGPRTTAEESVLLVRCTDDDPTTDMILAERTYDNGNGVVVDLALYWPQPPTGIAVGYTAPLVRWHQTTITGLTTSPIVLTSYWAQTYRPAHHNFGEDVMLEPRLDPDVPPGAVAELEAQDIVALYVDTTGRFFVTGRDGAFRTLP